MRRLLLCQLAIAALATPLVDAQEPPLWLAVGPANLTEAIAPLAKHRHDQGYEVLVRSGDVPAALAASPRRPDYLLILGDSQLDGGAAPAWNSPLRFGTLYRWRSVQPERYAADPAWADTDGDGVPDFPVGRIPARTPDQVASVSAKTIAFEGRTLSPADLGLPIWGGTPAYGKLLDEAGTTMLLSIVRKHAPSWSEPWMMFGNPRSPLSAHAASQPALFNQRLGAGGLITAMIGHGGPQVFLSQSTSEEEVIYHAAHTAALSGERPSPPHIVLACDCGSFAGGQPSLSEALLFASGGPVNVVAATTESHPLTNYYSALAVLAQLDSGHTRFGDLWHSAQLQAFKTKHRLAELLLKNAEGALEAEIDIPKLKRDQLLMYSMLGDPATQLPSIQSLAFKVEPEGESWRWEAEKPEGSTALHVEIRHPSTPPRSKPEGSTPAEAMRLFEQRNAAWQFSPLAKLPAAAPWTGTISDPGLLRLVATFPGGLAVATQQLAR